MSNSHPASALLAKELRGIDAVSPLSSHRYVSCVLGCPYEGKISLAKVAEVCACVPECVCERVGGSGGLAALPAPECIDSSGRPFLVGQ